MPSKFPFALLSAVLFLAAGCARAGDLDKAVPAPAFDPAVNAGSETAVLAGGCFWGQQGVFEHVKGVVRVVAGYAGGAAATAHYDMVGTETTGHAESVQITFDPRIISFGKLLQIYFSVAHDPTQLNAQGPDSGPSYRSEIFFADPVQEKIARAYVAQLSAAHLFHAPIVTRIERLNAFYRAEDYHQDFLVDNPDYPYIVINDLPKIAALAHVYPQYYRSRPVTLALR
ncbi:MAG TPA: peptide-methionine (S)-S-oxide reductase MsrA [Rhizomicrobium sp.]